MGRKHRGSKGSAWGGPSPYPLREGSGKRRATALEKYDILLIKKFLQPSPINFFYLTVKTIFLSDSQFILWWLNLASLSTWLNNKLIYGSSLINDDTRLYLNDKWFLY